MKKLYFGHPVNFYEGSDLNTHGKAEFNLIKRISKEFPEYSIENPNQPHHQENYVKWKKEKGSGMKYYFEEVLPGMDAGIFLTFEDGMFGAGVFGEAEFLRENGKILYEIDYKGKISNLALDDSRCLSIDETRKRVYPK